MFTLLAWICLWNRKWKLRSVSKRLRFSRWNCKLLSVRRLFLSCFLVSLFYRINRLSIRIFSCAPGTFGGLGITCTLCPSGTFALTSGTQISDTDLNFVGNRDSTFGNSSCTLCPIGTASGTITGAVVCTACSSGTFTDTIGSIQCKPCDLSNGALTCNPQTGKSSMWSVYSPLCWYVTI